MSDLFFHWEPTEQHMVVSASTKAKHHPINPLPLVQWFAAASSNQQASLLHILALVDNEKASASPTNLQIPYEELNCISYSLLKELDAPPYAPYFLDVQHEGTIDQTKFRFITNWLSLNQQPVLGAKQLGGTLTVGSKRYLIPHRIYQLLQAINQFHATRGGERQERFAALSQLQKYLPEAYHESIRTSGYLKSTRIGVATKFSLHFTSAKDSFAIEPILFGTQQHHAESGDNPECYTENQALLPKSINDQFCNKRLMETDGCKSTYALGSGWYIVLDEPLRRALEVVQRVQKGTVEEKRALVQNPYAVLAAALGDSLPQDKIYELYVETSEYSDRVNDIGVWENKKLPIHQLTNVTWLPEYFTISSGQKKLIIKPEEVDVVQQQIQAHLAQHQSILTWNDEHYDLNEAFCKEVSLIHQRYVTHQANLIEQEDKKSQSPMPQDSMQDETTIEGKQEVIRFVLKIKDNIETMDYHQSMLQRQHPTNKNLPTQLLTQLKPHQEEGFQWLQDVWTHGYAGALLADDMGLGKTLQALTFLVWLRQTILAQQGKPSPILIVTPVALIENWIQEHEQHFDEPGLGEVLQLHGHHLSLFRQGRQNEIDTGRSVLKTTSFGKYNWILTTYETIRDYQHSFAAMQFQAIVYDEMQKIKNPSSIMTHAAKALNSKFVLGMTGTPVENRLTDLWCIIDTALPGLLGTLRDFSKHYEANANNASYAQLQKLLNEPRDTLPPMMLRRMKADRLKGLPEKIEHLIAIEMPAKQADVYAIQVEAAKQRTNGQGMLETLQNMRSVSLHPEHPEQADLNGYADRSARLIGLLKTLDTIARQQEKAIVVIDSHDMQSYLLSFLQARYNLPHRPYLINGQINGKARQERVNRFQQSSSGFDIFLLSPKAGGIGLTLTAANHVIHLSRWWNPAVEDQSTDRAFRMGQTKPVHVYYLMAKHPMYGEQSFDFQLHALLQKKRSLSRHVLLPPVEESDTENLYQALLYSS